MSIAFWKGFWRGLGMPIIGLLVLIAMPFGGTGARFAVWLKTRH